MPAADRLEVEVVFILNHEPTLRSVVVRPIHRTIYGFTLTEQVTLGGFPVSGMELPPRALHPDGTPRLDLLSFRLRHRRDLAHIHVGQNLWLDGLRITPSIPLEVIRIENVDPTWRHILLRHLTRATIPSHRLLHPQQHPRRRHRPSPS